jgi:SOS response associated peptidase (SRAP)
MRWGLIPHWAKDIEIGFSTINAQAEEVDAEPTFREAFQRRHCLVPVDNFSKWHEAPLCCTDQQPGAVSPRSDIYVRRTYSGRPSSSMRFSEATAMATSVVCRPPVRERSASPITRL